MTGSRRPPRGGFGSRLPLRLLAGAALPLPGAIPPVEARQQYDGITITPASLTVHEGELKVKLRW